MIENLKANTGKSLEQWIAIVHASGLSKHGEVVNFLKENHSLTHGYANLVAHKAKGSDAGSVENKDDLIENQYKGKEGLLPLYEKIRKHVQAFGDDVEIAPKNANVSLRRKKQFAIVQPSTKNRLDVGIILKGVPPEGRLENSGSFSAMCTHRVRTEKIEDIDDTLIGWLKNAYEKAG